MFEMNSENAHRHKIAHSSPAFTEYKVLMLCCVCGLGVNAAIIIYSLLNQKIVLGLLTFIGAVPYVFAALLIRRERIRQAILIISINIIAFVIYSSVILGIGYGIDMLLWSVACLVLINANVKIFESLVFSLLCFTIFTFLHLTVDKAQNSSSSSIMLVFAALTLLNGIPLMAGMVSTRGVYLRQKQQLEKLANFDLLTGLRNRRSFYESLTVKNKVPNLASRPYCIAIGDIDRFKSINDKQGHDIGDIVLIDVAKVLSAGLTSEDALCRWGGEEFMFYLCNTNIQNAYLKVDELRKCVQKLVIQAAPELNITLSFGLVLVDPQEKIVSAVKRADTLLYKAKQNGRNRVEI